MKTYTTKEMAKELGVSPATIRNYAKDDTFMRPIEKFSGKQKRFEFTEEHLTQWRARLKEIQSQSK